MPPKLQEDCNPPANGVWYVHLGELVLQYGLEDHDNDDDNDEDVEMQKTILV